MPLRAQVISAVSPFAWAAPASAPAASRRPTIFELAFVQARVSGVTPYWSARSTSAPAAMSRSAISASSHWAAQWRAVTPSGRLAFTEAPSASNVRTAAVCCCRAASTSERSSAGAAATGAATSRQSPTPITDLLLIRIVTSSGDSARLARRSGPRRSPSSRRLPANRRPRAPWPTCPPPRRQPLRSRPGRFRLPIDRCRTRPVATAPSPRPDIVACGPAGRPGACRVPSGRLPAAPYRPTLPTRSAGRRSRRRAARPGSPSCRGPSGAYWPAASPPAAARAARP